MLFIHNDVVAKLLTMRECMDAQEHAFRQIPTGGAVHRPRIDMYVPCERDDGYYRWGTMEGANDGVFAIRMKSDVMTWPVGKDGQWRENKYCVRPGTTRPIDRTTPCKVRVLIEKPRAFRKVKCR